MQFQFPHLETADQFFILKSLTLRMGRVAMETQIMSPDQK